VSKAEDIFTDIYRTGLWRKLVPREETHSGAGSTYAATQAVRQFLPDLCRRLEVETFLDVPCGDFNWMRHVDLDVKLYVGADIVRELIGHNRVTYGRPPRVFLWMDLLAEVAPPPADLVLCRDCLQHLSFDDAWKAIENIRRSGATHLLTTTYTDRKNDRSIETGKWTPYNLQEPPFGFPEPDELLNEECREVYPFFTDKCLGLWKVADVPERSEQ